MTEKKAVAQKIVYDAFSIVEEKLGKNPLDAFVEALNNIMPSLEVKAKRVGGSTYQVPLEVRPELPSDTRSALDNSIFKTAQRENDG